MIPMVSPDVSSKDELISITYKPSGSVEEVTGLQKGNFRSNEGLLVDPVAPNEVVKVLKLIPLVSPDVYP